MLSSRVGKALYSTDVTQEFLQDLLKKAKKATSYSVQEYKKKQGGNRNRNRNSNRSNYNQNSNNNRYARNMKHGGGRKAVDNIEFHPMTSRINPKSGIPNQPQFKTKHSSSFDSDFLDVLDTSSSTTDMTSTLTKISSTQGKKLTSGKQEKRRTVSNKQNKYKKRPQQTGFIYTKAVNNTNKNIETQNPYEFQVSEFNPLSLLRYSSNLNINSNSRLISYVMKSMDQSNFPIYRDPNITYGNYNKKPNDIFTPRSKSFGKYVSEGSYSLDLKREPLLKNIKIEFDNSKFNKIVLGKYPVLNADKLSNSNERLIKTSLQNCTNLTNDQKSLLFDVCSGNKPIDDLLQK